MRAQTAVTWSLYCGARTLVRLCDFGDEPKAALREDGAAAAFEHALRVPPGDPECGSEWGVADVPAKLKLVARAGLEALHAPPAAPAEVPKA